MVDAIRWLRFFGRVANAVEFPTPAERGVYPSVNVGKQGHGIHCIPGAGQPSSLYVIPNPPWNRLPSRS